MIARDDVAKYAKEFDRLTLLYESKALTRNEYVELCQDILSLKIISAQCDNLNELSSLNKKITIAIELASMAASLAI